MFAYGTYVLEREVDATFSLGDIWKLFHKDLLPNNANSFCRQLINCMKPWNYQQKTSDHSLSNEVIKQTHGLMMEDEKDALVGECRKSPVFAGYHTFASAGHIERYMEDVNFRFNVAKKDDPIMAAINLIGKIINIHPFEDGN